MSQEKHVDGLTGQIFDTEEEYLSHVNEVTGYSPRDAEHHGVQGLRVSEKALKRTDSLKAKQSKVIESQLEKVRTEGVDRSVREKRADKTKVFGRITR